MTIISRKKQLAAALENVAKFGTAFRKVNRVAHTLGLGVQFDEARVRMEEETARVAAHRAAVMREELAKDERKNAGYGGRKRAGRHKKAGPSSLAAAGPERDARGVHGGKVARGGAACKAALLGEEEA